MTLILSERVCFQNKSLVTYEVEDIDNAKPGDTLAVRITLNLLPGWFIYAPTAGNKLQNVQIMALRFQPIPNVLRMLEETELAAIAKVFANIE